VVSNLFFFASNFGMMIMIVDDDIGDDIGGDDDDDIITGNTRWLWAISKIWKIWDLTCKISSHHHELLRSATPLNSILIWDLTCKISSYHHEVLRDLNIMMIIMRD